MSTSKPSALLDRAADVLVERGWFRGSTMPNGADPDTCPLCVLAAINVADGKHPDARLTGDALEAALALAEHLGIDLYDYHGPLDLAASELLGTGWNDRAGSAQVVAALRAAAQRERETGRRL